MTDCQGEDGYIPRDAPTPDSCQGIAGWCDPKNWRGYRDFGPGLPTDVQSLTNYVQGRFETIADEAQARAKNSSYIAKAILYAFVGGITTFYFLITSFAAVFTSFFPLPPQCESVRTRGVLFLRSVIRPIQLVTGIVPKSLIVAIDRWLAYDCPTELPGGTQLDLARLRGYITDSQWEFGQKLNGNCIGWAESVYKSQQTIFSISETMRLWNLGVCTSKQLPAYLRLNGVIEPRYVDAYKYMYETVPSLTDVFTMMQRDTENPAIQTKLGLNQDFEERLTGPLKAWAMRSGYTIDMMKALWRAHRPVIEQRVILRMYVAAQVEQDDMVELFRFNGHPKPVAEKLAAAIVRTYAVRRSAAEGKLTVKEIDEAFINRHISEQEYRTKLQDVKVPDDELQDKVDSSNFRRTQRYIKQKAVSVGKAFVQGRIDDNEGKAMLIRAGMDPATADDAIGSFRISRELSNKQLTAEKLCRFVSKQLMSMDEYLATMTRLGYSQRDASLLSANCATDIQEKLRLKAEKDQRKAVSDAEKALRKQRAKDKALRRLYRERFPCKAKAKPNCPPGVEPPPLETEIGILSG